MGRAPVIIPGICMKAKEFLLIFCLLYFIPCSFAKNIIDLQDSLRITEPISFCVSTARQEINILSITKADKRDNALVSNSETALKSNWYSFERPEPFYLRYYLKQSITPVAMAALGLGILGMTDIKLQLQENLNWNKDLKVPMYDDQLRYAPYAIGFILPLFGKYPKHKLLHLIPLVTGSYLLADGVVHQLKAHTAMARPNGAQEYDAFPSQHSSMAFVAATILHHEFGSYSPWISVGGYTLATWVAYSRLAQNHHWTSDVLTGAAVGMLSTHLVYLAYDFLSDIFTRKNLALYPYLIEGGGGVYLSFSF